MSDQAMAKMLRTAPVAFRCARQLSLVDAWKSKQAELEAERTAITGRPNPELNEDEQRQVAILDTQIEQCAGEAAKLELDVVEAEIFRLTYRDQWEVDKYGAEARAGSDDMSRKARVEFVAQVQLQARAFVLLRRPGTEGKVRLFTEDEMGSVDVFLAAKAAEAYDDAFRLRKDERPKA